MSSTLDRKNCTILAIDGKYVPAIAVHLNGDTHYHGDVRPQPNMLPDMRVWCSNETLNFGCAWYVVFASETQSPVACETWDGANAFLACYIAEQARLAAQTEKLILHEDTRSVNDARFTAFYGSTMLVFTSGMGHGETCDVCGRSIRHEGYFSLDGTYDVCGICAIIV